jgi:hypothetical protein
MGKTAFAMNIAEHVALEAGKSVAVYSFERSAEQLVLRPLCALARVEMQKIRQGFLNKMDVSNMVPHQPHRGKQTVHRRHPEPQHSGVSGQRPAAQNPLRPGPDCHR